MPRLLRTLVPALALAAALVTLAADARAQNDFASIGLFLNDVRNRPCQIDAPACDETVQVDGELFLPYYAYICVFNGDPVLGVAGVQLSLRYDSAPNSGVDVWEWNLCATFEFSEPGWPAARTGGTMTWDNTNNCQKREPVAGQGVSAVAGYLYVTAYSDDLLEVDANPAFGKAFVADCERREYEIPAKQLGSIGFSEDGSVEGSLPCVIVRIEETTWSGVKRVVGSDSN